MGGATEPPMGAELTESVRRKKKYVSMLGDGDDYKDLFNMEKAQANIMEMETKIKEILND